MDSQSKARAGWARALAVVLGWVALAAAPAAELVITGQILYGKAEDARRAAVADVVRVYHSNPAYMRMRDAGLSETDGGRGSLLFEEARSAANKSLATAASRRSVDVITTPGGASGGSHPIDDVTDEVIEGLPIYYVEGVVLAGKARQAHSIGEVASETVLFAMPAYLEWLGLGETDARYHILQKQWNDDFNRVVRKVMLDAQHEAIVERGGTTSRLGPVPDLTQDAISAL